MKIFLKKILFIHVCVWLWVCAGEGSVLRAQKWEHQSPVAGDKGGSEPQPVAAGG